MDAEKVSKAMKDGTLKLVSSTGFSMPVTQKPKPRISKNWDFDMSFDELCEKAIFCYRFPKSHNRDECKPHFVLQKGERLDFVSVSNDRFGIMVSGEGSSPYSLLSEIDGLEITKDGAQMVLDYLTQTNASDLILT